MQIVTRFLAAQHGVSFQKGTGYTGGITDFGPGQMRHVLLISNNSVHGIAFSGKEVKIAVN